MIKIKNSGPEINLPTESGRIHLPAGGEHLTSSERLAALLLDRYPWLLVERFENPPVSPDYVEPLKEKVVKEKPAKPVKKHGK